MLPIDLRSREPIYEQIVNNFKKCIVRGIIKEDEKVLSVRELAKQLSVNPNTVQKAYRQLELEGYIYTVKGKGNFVNKTSELNPKIKEEVFEKLDTVIKELKLANINKEEIIKYIKNSD